TPARPPVPAAPDDASRTWCSAALPRSASGLGLRPAQQASPAIEAPRHRRLPQLALAPFDEIADERARLGEDVRCSNRYRRIASILSNAASGDNGLPIAGSAAASIRSV